MLCTTTQQYKLSGFEISISYTPRIYNLTLLFNQMMVFWSKHVAENYRINCCFWLDLLILIVKKNTTGWIPSKSTCCVYLIVRQCFKSTVMFAFVFFCNYQGLKLNNVILLLVLDYHSSCCIGMDPFYFKIYFNFSCILVPSVYTFIPNCKPSFRST